MKSNDDDHSYYNNNPTMHSSCKIIHAIFCKGIFSGAAVELGEGAGAATVAGGGAAAGVVATEGARRTLMSTFCPAWQWPGTPHMNKWWPRVSMVMESFPVV